MAIRRSAMRGRSQLDGAETWYSFSFGRYLDPEHMGFGPLRAINETQLAPGKTFGDHGQANMEILTLVLEGQLEHRDAAGISSILEPGDVHHLSAGLGTRCALRNPSDHQPTRFLELWVVPETDGLPPAQQIARRPADEPASHQRLLGSRNGRDRSVAIRRDVEVCSIGLAPAEHGSRPIAEGRALWVQVLRGPVTINGHALSSGDGFSVRRCPMLEMTAGSHQRATCLVCDLEEALLG